MSAKCDHGGCQTDAEVTLTAAYPVGGEVHPHWAAYPVAMFRACRSHAVALIETDRTGGGSTEGFIIRLIDRSTP